MTKNYELMNDTQREIVDVMETQVITISDYDTPKKFRELSEKLYEFAKQGFEFDEIIKGPMQVRFHDRGEHYPIQLNHLIFTFFIWQPIVELGGVDCLNEKCFLYCPTVTADTIKKFFDDFVIAPFRHKVKNKKMNIVLEDANFQLGRISTDFNILMPVGIDIEQSFLFPSMRNERFNEIIHTTFDDSKQIGDNEQQALQLTDELIELIKADPDNLLSQVLRSGTGIKSGQLGEFAVIAGYKPDLQGNTIPLAVNTNLVVNGLNSVISSYVDSSGGLKAAVANKLEMGRSGHTTRLLILLASNVKLDNDTEDCGTLFGVTYTIKSKKHLRSFQHRWYREPHSQKYKILKGDEDYLIGNDIIIRSPITCVGGIDDNHICKKCYGELHLVNSDLNSIGAFGSTKTGMPVGQNVLSTKHLLQTSSSRITFKEKIFFDVFDIFSNEIEVKNGCDVDSYSIVIKKEDVHTMDEYDIDLDDNKDSSYVTNFILKNDITGETVTIVEDKETRLLISSQLNDVLTPMLRKSDVAAVPLYEVKDNGPVFMVIVENDELTKPLYDIINLLNNKGYRKEEGIETFEDIAQHMIDLIIISKIGVDAVHAELIVRELIRSADDILERPDFTKYSGASDVEILTLFDALSHHPSVTVSMAFQYLKRQLTNPETFRKRGTSFNDPYFKTNL